MPRIAVGAGSADPECRAPERAGSKSLDPERADSERMDPECAKGPAAAEPFDIWSG
jgi:hypothetical protein